VLVLLVQLAWMPRNTNTTDFNFPRSEAAIEREFADYRPGLTVQIGLLPGPGPDRSPDGAYRDLLFGNMYAVADVESLTAYSGVAFTAFDVPLCTEYQGALCADAWDTLWERPDGSDEVLADLIRAETVVVRRGDLDTRDEPEPDGWELAESTEHVDVWRRTEPLPHPDGRVSAVSGPVDVTADERVGAVGESITVERTGSGPAELTFARLAWPGYTAEIDGREVPVQQGPNGLLTIALPEDAEGTLTLSWAPPGSLLSLAAVAVALAGVAALTVVEIRQRRAPRRPRAADRSTDPDAAS
jgi:hypothetical protein